MKNTTPKGITQLPDKFVWRIDLSADTAAILISIVSSSYYGMPRGQIHINLPPEHPILSFETIEIKMAAVFCKKVYDISSVQSSLLFLSPSYSFAAS